jgi:site-specific recombinase XerD
MLRQLFPHGYRRYEVSRHARDLEDFHAWLEASGYGRACSRGHVFRLRATLDRLRRAKPGSFYTVAQLKRVFGAECATRGRAASYRATQRAYQRFLASRGRLICSPAAQPFAALQEGYRRQLLEVRGLVAETVAQHEHTVQELLSTLSATQGLAALTHQHIEQFLAAAGRRSCRQRLQHIVAHLRSFLRYCHDEGEIEQPLHIIDTPRVYQAERPPRALPWPLVQALLASIDRTSRSGWRDYVLLHLLAYYGLRPSEVVALTLDAIDWTRGTLTVSQRKTRATLLLPLAAPSLTLLRRYLRREPAALAHSALFLRARSPAGPLTRYAVTDIFEARVRQSGLPITGYSVYSLRHAFAMRLLTRGVGLKAIGDLLGHRHLESTCQYLRLDVEMLRDVALAIPTHTDR